MIALNRYVKNEYDWMNLLIKNGWVYVATLSVTSFFLYMGMPNLFRLFISLFVGIFVLFVCLNRKHMEIAHHLIWLQLNSAIFVLAMSLGRELGVHYLFVALAAIQTGLFRWERKRTSFMLVGVSMLLFIISELQLMAVMDWFEPRNLSQYEYVAYIRFGVMISSILYVTFVLIRMKYQSEKTKRDLLYSLEDAKEQKLMMQKLSEQASMSALSMGIAHEIRNPIAGMLARVEIIEEKDAVSKDEIRQFSTIFKRNIQRILSITDSMLSFGQSSKSTGSLVLIRDILSDVRYVVEGNCHKANIQYHEEFSDSQHVTGNSNEIHQVFLNLVLNAMQSIHKPGHIYVRSWDDVHEEVEGVKVTIQDTGIGIDPDVKDKIFDMFYSQNKYNHTGLGLATVMKNISNHSGYLDVESTPGEGTTFSVFLPV